MCVMLRHRNYYNPLGKSTAALPGQSDPPQQAGAPRDTGQATVVQYTRPDCITGFNLDNLPPYMAYIQSLAFFSYREAVSK